MQPARRQGKHNRVSRVWRFRQWKGNRAPFLPRPGDSHYGRDGGYLDRRVGFEGHWFAAWFCQAARGFGESGTKTYLFSNDLVKATVHILSHCGQCSEGSLRVAMCCDSTGQHRIYAGIKRTENSG